MLIDTELNEIIETSQSINVYKDGEIDLYSRNDEPYAQIISEWKYMTDNARDMPAFGVSLNKETTAARNNGLWVEFVFDKCKTHNEMPFEKLLVNVERQWQGFNIIRYNSDEGYSGRCFYYELVNKDMSNFYDLLMNL